MARKTTIFSLSLAAALASISVIGLSATAQTGGHFTTEVANTYWVGSEEGTHRTEFNASGEFIFCEVAGYEGFTQGAGTFTEVKFSPLYDKCITTANEGAVTITENECTYVFTIGAKAHQDNTVHLSCPTGKKLEMHTPNCKLSFPPQTPQGGVAYTAVTANGKNALTVDVTISGIKYERHSGLCVFLGTNGTDGELKGSVTVAGFNLSDGKPASIAATGSGGT